MAFGCDDRGIEVSAADLDAELPIGNAELARVNGHVMLEYLARFDTKSIGLRVRTKLLEQLPSRHACESSVAEALNMTERTRQRRLRDEGTSYKGLLDEVRRELAAQCVAELNLSFSEGTYLLGFSEHSKFSRAFKRWTGKSPSVYRAAAAPSNGGQIARQVRRISGVHPSMPDHAGVEHERSSRSGDRTSPSRILIACLYFLKRPQADAACGSEAFLVPAGQPLSPEALRGGSSA